jgi:hypothetical protein
MLDDMHALPVPVHALRDDMGAALPYPRPAPDDVLAHALRESDAIIHTNVIRSDMPIENGNQTTKIPARA